MWAWYRNCDYCVVYLEDFTAASVRKTFWKSKWFTRGWSMFLAYNLPLRHYNDHDRMSRTLMAYLLTLGQHFRSSLLPKAYSFVPVIGSRLAGNLSRKL